MGADERDRVIRREQRDSRAKDLLADMRGSGKRVPALEDAKEIAKPRKRKRRH